MELVHYPKGHHVLEIGKIERDIYFISKGIVRAFTLVDGKEVTFWVGKEGATIVSMMGYVKNEPGYETMELMEDSELYVIKRAKLQQLYNEDIHIANWGRRFAETELLDAEVRVITLLLATATERYRDLLDNQSDLLQRLPLGCIASYLGITQVSLSRIRASIVKGNKQSI
jgi:CRP-like cAMP-binding protein